MSVLAANLGIREDERGKTNSNQDWPSARRICEWRVSEDGKLPSET
jgi:hypothetical protein